MVMHESPLPSKHVVGSDDGCALGVLLGSDDGADVGCADGTTVGLPLGTLLGTLLGAILGCALGCVVGAVLGSHDGCAVGEMLGCSLKHCTNGTPSTTAEFGIWASSLAMIAALFELASSSNPSGNTIAWPVSLIVLIACSSGSRSFRSSNI